jgi:VanZ family protein|tara:strand:- start:392 stop:775 length:384 start_codon:yes stop_codon:yes gene_type:complete
MKKINTVFLATFHFINLILIIFYLYPGSIAGCVFYKDCTVQPQITGDFLVSSNHFYTFIFLSLLGLLAYHNTKKINFLIKYLFFISIILEFFHIMIPNRKFEFSDLFGNILGVLLVIIIYKFKKKYV